MEILFKNHEFLAINKPPGVLVHVFSHQKNEKGPTVVDWAIKHFPEVARVGDDLEYRPGVVHRLDRETSGALLIARTQKTFEYLKSLFQNKKIRKTYYAITHGAPKDQKGTITYAIGIKSGTTKRTIHGTKQVKEAITDYEVVQTIEKDGEQFSLIKVMPHTGRTHQIRIHLNAIHTPVIGDKLYGGKKNATFASRHMLHCYSLEFTGVDGDEICVIAPVPEDFLGYFDKSDFFL